MRLHPDAALQLEGFYKEISSPLLQNVTFTYPAEVGVANLTETDFYNFFDGTEIVVAGRIGQGMTARIDCNNNNNNNNKIHKNWPT